MQLCFEAILLNDVHTHMYWVWAVGGVNNGYETKLWIWLPLENGIPWSFDDNIQFDYAKN
jgi:hypothetical protein